MDTWRDVVGFEDFYEVSSAGRVRSKERTVHAINRWGKAAPRTYPAKELRATTNRHRGGYRYVNLHKDGQHMKRVAVLVAEAFIGPRPDGQQVCHSNGNPLDDRADNLRYDTPKGNASDKLSHGTLLRGEKHPQARLSDEDVADIRRLRGAISQKALADKYGVHHGHINNIQCGVRRA